MNTLGVIGGSGITSLGGLEVIREHTFPTPYGTTSSPIVEGRLTIDGRLGSTRIFFLERHGPGHSIAPHEINYRANIAALKVLGVSQIVSLSAVGSLKDDVHPGDVVVVDQYLDFTRQRRNTFFEGGAVAHVSMAEPVCAALASATQKALTSALDPSEKAQVHARGTYVCIDGPQFSTRAESHYLRSLGASVVGMTALPEAKLAREVELPYVTVAFVTDYDAWHEVQAPVNVEGVLAVLRRSQAKIPAFLAELVETLPDPTKSTAYFALHQARIGVSRGQLTERLSWLRPNSSLPTLPSQPPSSPLAGAASAASGQFEGPVVPASTRPASTRPASTRPASVRPDSVGGDLARPPGAESTPPAAVLPPKFVESERETWTGSAPPPRPKSAFPPSTPSAPPASAPSPSQTNQAHSTDETLMTQSNAVLIIGSMALDDLELPSGTFTNVVGGAATFASIAAALFSPARIVAVVGADFPEPVLSELGRRKIETEGIARMPGRTFKWVGRYAQNLASRETLDTQLNVFADFRPVLPEAYRKSRFVLLGNIHPALQLEVLDQLEPGAFVAADTMNFWIQGERGPLEKLLQRIDCLIINDEELRELSGLHNIRQGAAKVLAMGPKKLLVKKGEHGALLFDGNRIGFVPAYPLEVEIDPTGAGDSFAGAFLGRLAELGRSDTGALAEAMPFAATVASFCVEGVGLNRLSEITRADVDSRLRELADMTRLAL